MPTPALASESLSAALRHLRDGGTPSAWAVVRRCVHAAVNRTRIHRTFREDLAAEIVARIYQKVATCRALDLADSLHAEKATRAWMAKIVRNEAQKLVEKEVRAKPSTENWWAAKSPSPEAEVLTAQWWDAFVVAWLGAVKLEALPEDLAALAAAKTVATTVDGRLRDLTCWLAVRLRGHDALAVGQSLDYGGDKQRIVNRVQQHAKRGAWAFVVGALATAREPANSALADVLSEMAAFFLSDSAQERTR